MPASTVDALLLALAFLVPGYVIDRVRSWFLTRRQREGRWAWLHFLALSGLNFVFWSWLIEYLLKDGLRHAALLQIAGWTTILFISPAVIGALLGKLAQSSWTPALLNRLGVHITSPLPRAWDHAFRSTRDSHWVIARLKGGAFVTGLFGEHSSAGSELGYRDLFIEDVYERGEDGTWQRPSEPRSIWISDEALESVEFIPMEESDGRSTEA